MKKIVLALALFAVAVSPALAGNLTVSGRAGLFSPNGGSSSMMYGLGANYALNDNLSVRGAIETTSYDVGGVSTSFTPVTLDLIYSQTMVGMITPYAGAGLSYNTTTAGGVSKQTSGGQAEAGIKFELGGFMAGVEYRYMLTDLSNSNSGASTYNAYMTGGFSQSFNL